MNKFNQTTPPVQIPSPPTYADRQFLHTFLAGAFLPLVQATITAVMVGIGTLTVLYLVDAIDKLKPSLIVAAIVWVVTWLFLQRRWLTLTSLEQITGIDFNQDGQIGKPVKEPEQFVIRLDEITADKHYRSRSIDSVISKEQLTIVARGLLNGIPFSERSWTGSGKPLSINEFRSLRSVWLKHALIEVANDKDPRQGFELTDQGWAVMEKLAGLPVLRTQTGVAVQSTSPEEETPEESEMSEEELEAIRDEMARNADQYQ